MRLAARLCSSLSRGTALASVAAAIPLATGTTAETARTTAEHSKTALRQGLPSKLLGQWTRAVTFADRNAHGDGAVGFCRLTVNKGGAAPPN
jgi:hypothetical protein